MNTKFTVCYSFPWELYYPLSFRRTSPTSPAELWSIRETNCFGFNGHRSFCLEEELVRYMYLVFRLNTYTHAYIRLWTHADVSHVCQILMVSRVDFFTVSSTCISSPEGIYEVAVSSRNLWLFPSVFFSFLFSLQYCHCWMMALEILLCELFCRNIAGINLRCTKLGHALFSCWDMILRFMFLFNFCAF